MRDLQSLRGTLAELLDAHDRLVDRRKQTDARRPRLRLQDWELVETLSSGTRDYAILVRVPRDRHGVAALTTRERDVVRRACAGFSNKEIAHQMRISSSTVRVMVSRACRKLEVADRDHLIQYFSIHRRVDTMSR